MSVCSSCNICNVFFTISSISPTLLKNHDTPCLLTSGIPPVFELMTGTPAAIASNAASQKLSVSEGSTNRSHALSSFSGFFIFPKKWTSSQIFSSLQSFSIFARSGQSPIRSNFAGIFCFTCANVCMTSSILFTFLKLDIWMRIRSPLLAYFCLISSHAGPW